MRTLGKLIGIGLALLAALFAIGALHGCAVLDRGQAAVHVDDYKKATDVCLAEGKKVNSMAVFDRCLREVDIHYGLATADGGVK